MPRYERALQLGLLALLVALGWISFDRAARGRYDFHHFYLDARYVWEHRALNPDLRMVYPDRPESNEPRQLPFYLPTVPLLLAPLTAWGRTPAALVWVALQIAALGITLRILRTWTDQTIQPRATLVFAGAILLATPALYEAAHFNQLSVLILALLVGGLALLERGRPALCGTLFALATVLKLLPGLLLVWLLLKRQWRAAGSMLAIILALTILPPLVAFGPERTLAYHREWWTHNITSESAGGMLNNNLPDHFIDHHNQSVAQVLARWTWPEHRFRLPWQPAALSVPTIGLLTKLLLVALLAHLLWYTRAPWPALPPTSRRAELAVYAIALLVLAPLVRQYYLIWVLPALVLLCSAACDEDVRRRTLGRAGLFAWALGLLAWLWEPARLGGAHLLMLLILGEVLLRLARQPAQARRASVNSVISGGQLNRS